MSDATTTRARFWRVERTDGRVFGYTDHDRDLEFGGTVFRAHTGLGAGAVERSLGLSVDNATAAGALSDDGITEVDLAAGRWDGATVTAYEADWSNPAEHEVTFRGTFGEIVRTDGAFRVELRGLAEALNRPIGRVYQKGCDAALGDRRCGVDLNAPGLSVEIELDVVEPSALSWAGFDAFGDRWFEHGRVLMLDGAAAGLEARVRRDLRDEDGRRLELWQGFGIAPAPGDRVRIEAGCDKRAETCRVKFGNLLSFRGCPFIPGEDWLTAYPVTGGRNDGGSLAG